MTEARSTASFRCSTPSSGAWLAATCAASGQGHSLHTTALVHEAYLRLVDYTRVRPESVHFFAIAAQAMRRILVERARQRRTARRGAGAQHVPLEDVASRAEERAAHLLALDEALERLARFDARKAQVVELKYFGGLTIDETADVVGVSTPTVEREWRAARLWLYREMARKEANR